MAHSPGGLDPILCAPLLREVDGKLIALLSSLTPDDWDRQTVAPLWKVRDVAAHLLDTPLRKLAIVRDRYFVEPAKIGLPGDLIEFITRLNREGVTVYRRLSPPVLIDLMKLACDQSATFHESLDPFAPAAFNVSWAGEERSLNWFDTARELTERWHHQQQIRLATNRPGILTPELYHPVLDCFLRGLPHAYRDVHAVPGTKVLVTISGNCGGDWLLCRGSSAWGFVETPGKDVVCQVTIPQALAWRLFTKGIDRGAARPEIKMEGDRELGERILGLTSIVG